MKVMERDWNWWAYFWRVQHRQTIRDIKQWDKKVVRFISHELGCTRGQTLLDLGCGSGEHTRLLAQKGVQCTGIEIARSLVQYARKHARLARVNVDYVCMDMRHIAYREQFDCCTMISGTFGFFSDTQNRLLLRKIARALRPGGKLLLDVRNARAPRKTGTSWMKLCNGYLVMADKYDAEHKREHGDCLFIDASGNANVLTSALRRATNRLYTLSEMKTMLRDARLRYLHAYCGFRIPPKELTPSYRGNIVVVAQK